MQFPCPRTTHTYPGYFASEGRGGKIALNSSYFYCLAWEDKKSFVSSCITDPPRRQALGAVKVQPGAAFLPRLAQVWKIRKNQRASPRNHMRVLGLMGLLSINKLHNTANAAESQLWPCMILNAKSLLVFAGNPGCAYPVNSLRSL